MGLWTCLVLRVPCIHCENHYLSRPLHDPRTMVQRRTPSETRENTPFLDGVYLVTLELEFFQDLKLAFDTDPLFTRPSQRSWGSTRIG